MLRRTLIPIKILAILLCGAMASQGHAQTVDGGAYGAAPDSGLSNAAPGAQYPTPTGTSMPNGLGNSPANRMGTGRGAGPDGRTPSLADQAAAARAAGVKPAQDMGSDRQQARTLPPLTETEYQRFIRETTGRKLALYGYNLFENGAFPSLQNVPVPADYVVGPGDEIRLRLWGAVDVDLSLTVDRNGQITIPRVGTLNVAGLKSSQMESTLKAQVGRIFNNFQLNATLGQLRSMQVFVVGQARQPGAYSVSSLSSLISALFESGGPAATGSMRNIQLKRDGQLVSTIDLYKFITLGDKTADARLLPGDVIVIPPAGPRVALMGMLDSPAVYELGSAEETLSQLLAYAGGVLALTAQHKVLVERIDPGQVKAPRSVQERKLDDAGLASTVRDGDVVTLLKINPEFANAVTLRGNVAVPVRHAYREGMRVSDLIPDRDALIQPDYYTRKNLMVQFEPDAQGAAARARRGASGNEGFDARSGRSGNEGFDARSGRSGNDGFDARTGRTGNDISESHVATEIKNLLPEINWEYAVIERLDATEVRSTLIPFNLGRAVREKNPADNLALRPGDVVTIFGVNDIPVPMEKRTQFVRIAGEVKIPGIYQIQPGELLSDVITRAGGVTSNAYLYGMMFTRESTRAQQQANLNLAIRRMEADVGSRSATALQNLSDQDRGLAQAQLETQRQMLARLQSLKASGRIALELDPDHPQLPPIAMEDGDQIMVPNRPSFVGVYGAVMAETSFLHRRDATVKDYMDRAGLTVDAEEDATLIIRADGSVEGNQAIRSWFGGSDFMSRKLQPGDSVFVPERLDRRTGYTRFIQGAKDWTAIFYQFGIGAAALKTLR